MRNTLLPQSDQSKSFKPYEPAASLFMTVCALKLSVDELREYGMGASNVWSMDHTDTERMYKELFDTSLPIKSCGCYVTSGSLKDKESCHHAPQGYSTVEVLTMVRGDVGSWCDGRMDDYRKDNRYQATKRKLELEMLDRLGVY